KIDGVTVATDYVDAAVVDENLQYTSEPNHTACDINSNEIFFAFWGSEGNIISAYQDENPYAHQGIRGDFNENTAIDSVDLVALKAVLLGTEECDETADFNNDNTADVRDLVAMKRHLAPARAHERSGRLVVGIQEHLEEDATKTAAYIAEASATLGARSYRLSMPIHYMFRPTVSGGVEIRYEHLNRFREMVRQLKANGIDEILYVSSGFVEPYGYDDPLKTHGSTVPDPIKEPENYQNWLQVNAAAYRMLAQEFPELKYFEPFNEINVDEGSGLEKYGVNMQSSAEEHATHKYTVEERAGIMADLCWYISRAVKSVDRANQVTTPSISFNIVSHVESDFLEAFYNCMESGVYPRGQRCGDINTNNYFTVLNIHSYKGYSPTNADVDGWVAEIDGMYDVVRRHNDTAKPVWMTETGCADSAGRDRVGENIVGALQAVETRLPYIDTVHIYKLANASNKGGAVVHETNYGLFCSGDDAVNPYGIKNSTKIVYSYLHNGSTDYSPLYALANRYAG
ncbi:MAG: dockerin type I repeat-containing protein, partial [Clostridia bacterium]|nr:dockerin type I repeat-containing protein [Clostridia bacterium]